jgi:hypothetical protein
VGTIAAAAYASVTSENVLRPIADAGVVLNTNVPLIVPLAAILAELALMSAMTALGLKSLGRLSLLTLLQDNPTSRKRKNKAAVAVAEAAFTPPRLGGGLITPLPEQRPYTAAKQTTSYIARHIRRTAAKSLLSVLLAAVLFSAIGQFTAMRQSYETLYRTIEVKPRFFNGLPYSMAAKLAETDYVHSPYYEIIVPGGDLILSSTETEPTTEPLTNTLTVYITSDLRKIDGVQSATNFSFINGYNAETVMQLAERVCVMPSALMAQFGLQLGDEVLINETQFYFSLLQSNPPLSEENLLESYLAHGVKCRIVGQIECVTTSEVYVSVDTAWKYFWSWTPVRAGTLDLAEFTLSNYHQAEEFRGYVGNLLENVRGTKPLFVMDTTEADNIYRIYRLINVLYPLAIVVAVLIGAFLPGLIILQTAKEAAIMRVLGTSKQRTRVTLTLEQVALCIIGLTVAFAVIVAVNGVTIRSAGVALGLYSVAHIVGCAIVTAFCSVLVTKRKIMELLQVKE